MFSTSTPFAEYSTSKTLLTWSFSEKANGNYTQLSGSDMANEIKYVATYVPPSTSSSSDSSSDDSATTSYTSDHSASDFVSTTAEAVKDKVEEVEDAVGEKWNKFKSWVTGE